LGGERSSRLPPAILLASAATYPTHLTWLVGVALTASGATQLASAAYIARLEHRQGAHVLRTSFGDFFLARGTGGAGDQLAGG
jgi:hypothetical protein